MERIETRLEQSEKEDLREWVDDSKDHDSLSAAIRSAVRRMLYPEDGSDD